MFSRLRRDSKASTAVEFAIVGWMLCMVTFAIVETGLLWWLKSGMQLTASMTARCGAMGYVNTYNTVNFLCTNTATTQNYAVNYALGLMGNNANTTNNTITNMAGPVPWLLTNMITTNDVTVNGKVTSCNGFTGNFFSVSISSGFFAFLPPPLGNYTSLTASACYPMP
jgi:Flp pilus assembly protein TadG